MSLRNISNEKAEQLSGMIESKPGQVSSMSLTRNAGFDMTLLAFASGESVSEEEYFGDVLYYVLEGALKVVFENSQILVSQGEVLKVDAHVVHAIEGLDEQAFKVLQINTYE